MTSFKLTKDVFFCEYLCNDFKLVPRPEIKTAQKIFFYQLILPFSKILEFPLTIFPIT